jgi:hypothetical protein
MRVTVFCKSAVLQTCSSALQIRRWFDAVSPLIVRAFRTPGAEQSALAAAAAAAADQQQQQLRAGVYQAVNQLLEGSCCGSEVQLLVLPLALQDVLQEFMPDACLTGVLYVLCVISVMYLDVCISGLNQG